MNFKDVLNANKKLLENIFEATKPINYPYQVVNERERMRCVDIAYEAADYTEIEAMSAAYMIAQKYPQVLLRALATRFEERGK